jgi:tetratricopeptide (TPR) repeat protein
MRELDFLGPLAHKFQSDEHNSLNLNLRPLETNPHYILYLLKDKNLEAVEAELRARGVHENIIESDIYQLRQDLDTAEEIFYTNIAAMDSLDRITFEDASPVDQQIHLATQFIRDKDYVTAGKHLKKALYLDPDAILAYANQGVIALRRKNKKRALELFNTVLSIDPDHIQALTYKMYILSSSRTATLTEFTAVVDKLLQLRPFHPAALQYKWHLVHHSQDLDEIIEYTKLNFKINFLEQDALDELLNVVLWMTAEGGREFLDHFGSELKGNLIQDVFAQFRERHETLIAGLKDEPDVILVLLLAEQIAEVTNNSKKGEK